MWQVFREEMNTNEYQRESTELTASFSQQQGKKSDLVLPELHNPGTTRNEVVLYKMTEKWMKDAYMTQQKPFQVK